MSTEAESAGRVKVEVLFFASLRDAVGSSGLSIELPQAAGQRELLLSLAEQLSEAALTAVQAENVRISVNQTLVTQTVVYSDGDEIAFLPPITGG